MFALTFADNLKSAVKITSMSLECRAREPRENSQGEHANYTQTGEDAVRFKPGTFLL